MFQSNLLQPNLILGANILELSPTILQENQVNALILDVDDTLVPLTGAEVSPEVRDWLLGMREYVEIWLVSNNVSQSRIGRIANTLELPYSFGAAKPSRRKLRHVVKALDFPPAQIAMVGDRLFTDILAGNRLGLFTILVEPMVGHYSLPSFFSLRDWEFRLCRAFGLSLGPAQQNLNKNHKSSEN